MSPQSDIEIWYVPEISGSLENYLRLYDSVISFPLFRGYDHYALLWDKGYLVPGVSIIHRVKRRGDDETYLVISKEQIMRLEECPGFGENPDIRELLELWECWGVQHINHNSPLRNSENM